MHAEAQLSVQQRFRIAKARSRRLLEKFDPSEPRDDTGKWTSGGGDGAGEHDDDALGPGYSDAAKLIDGVIHTSDVYDAVRALHENRKVELTQPRQVSILLDKLGEISKQMIAQGKKAPTFDLCNVTIKGTSLFCADAKGIPRVKMPQIPKELDEAFVQHLKDQGYNVTLEHQFANHLRATQNELNGAKVAGIAKRKREGNYNEAPIFVSNDDYILDGHHRWAAEIGNDAADNVLGNSKKMPISRVDIDIIKLLDEAEKFTQGKGKLDVGDSARKQFLERWRAVHAQARELLKFDPSQPRDDAGKWTSGGGGADAGTTAPASSTPSSSSASKPKGKPASKDDFTKAKINIASSSEAGERVFIDKWNDKVGVEPAAFKHDFMGGLDGPMTVSMMPTINRLDIEGRVEQDGKQVGTFTRNIYLDDKTAYSAYFKLEKAATGHDVGKKLLAGNVDTYQKLGVQTVRVGANIDVGGYAWAKYGYIPTLSSWIDLRGRLASKLGGETSSSSGSSRSSSGVEADDWDQLSSDTQDDVRDRWMRDSYDEFYNSEVENWREGGQAKDDAKRELADQFTNYQVSIGDVPAWVNEALDSVHESRAEEDQPPIPYTNRQLYDAVELKYDSRRGDGEDDADIGFDDNMLKEPAGYDPAQQTLPGIEPVDPSTHLTPDMRDQIEKALGKAFDKKAEDDAGDMDPPSYIADSVGEYQDEYWDQFSDREKLAKAIDYGMADIPVESDDEEAPQQEMELPKPEPTADPLLAALKSDDPKSIWKIADDPRGKRLLLGTSWDGRLHLNDKEQMARFNKYVGRAA